MTLFLFCARCIVKNNSLKLFLIKFCRSVIVKCLSENGRRPRAESESVVRGKTTAMWPRSSHAAAVSGGRRAVGGRGPWLVVTVTATRSRHFHAAAVREGAAWSRTRAGARGTRDVDGGATAVCSDAATGKPRRRRERRTPRGRSAPPP